MQIKRLLLLFSLLVHNYLDAQQMEITIADSMPYYISNTIHLQIYLTNTTSSDLTYFDSQGPSYNSFKEEWDVNVNDLRLEIYPLNGQFSTTYSDSIIKTLAPGKKALIRTKEIPLYHSGHYSVTYTQYQSAEYVDKSWAGPSITDSIIKQITPFKISKNIQFEVHKPYDTIVTEFNTMTWEEWKAYRQVKVYSRDNFFDNIYMALKTPNTVFALAINCSGFTLEEIKRLNRLKNLKALTLLNFEQDTFPKELAELELYELKIYTKDGHKTIFPAGFSTNNTLRELTAKFNNTFPQSLLSLTNLIYLDINDCNISNLPSLCTLQQLEELIANNNQLTTLQNLGLESLPRLKSINLSGNKAIADIIPLMKCPTLEFLTINRTAITIIPDEIANLKNLKRLSVSSGLIFVSDSIGKLSDLRYLSFSGNTQLDSIPKSITKLSKLLHLDLSRTNIHQLPEGTVELPLEKVYIYNTPCTITKDYKELKKRLGDDFKD